jgi:hypothetical protein
MIWILVALAYVLGHFVTGVGTRLLALAARFLPFVKSDKVFSGRVAAMPVYASFVRQAYERWPHLAVIPKDDVHEWRNVAMSVLSPDENHTVYRFMFISLLNLGAGTVVVLLIVAWLAASIAGHFSFLQPWGSFLFPHRRPLDIGVLFAALIVSYFFFERRGAFYPRALRVPFSMAIVKLDTTPEATPATLSSSVASTKPAVYLAGGMRSHWQDIVIGELEGTWNVIDPRCHHLADERQYTYWDLNGVSQSDWVLAHLESTNPGGYNLAVEVGYAKALGKHIILVDGKSDADETVRRYTGMLRGCADVTSGTLHEAIIFLQKLVAPRRNP